MANKQRGFVSVKLDKQRKLKYTFNAFCELEDVLGRSLSELGDSFKMKDLRSLLWAGLLHENEDLTLIEAGKLIDEAESIQSLSEDITEAIQLAMGENKEQGKN